MSESFTYILISVCFVAFFIESYFSFVWAEILKSNKKNGEKLSKKRICKAFLAQKNFYLKNFSFTKWLCTFSLAAASAAAIYAVQLRGMHILFVAKIIVCLAVLIAVAAVDANTHTIPNILSIILIAARLIFIPFELIYQKDTFKTSIIASVIGLVAMFIILYFIHRITRRGFGMGDVKILSSLGFAAGISSCLTTILLGMILAAVMGILLILLKKKNRKDVVPFGPFIYFGYAVAALSR